MTQPGSIYLLDLNYTLVSNSRQTMRVSKGVHYDVAAETYRQWLVDLLRGSTVILITARTADYEQETLASIAAKTAWRPDLALFKPLGLQYRPAHEWKQIALYDHVFPAYGERAAYLALESNSQTRAMYAAEGISAIRVPDAPWSRLPVPLPRT